MTRFAWLGLVVACGGAPVERPVAEAPAVGAATTAVEAAKPAEVDARLAKAEAAAKLLGGRLKARLTEAMTQGGPVAAVGVCADEAPAIRAAVAAETGVTVGRASLRLRSPADAGPAWVTAWLTAQGERPAAGVVGVSEVVEDGGASVARRLLPIAVEAPCLACHGATLAPEVKAALAARYPADAATGYALGDLRGALWAEAR
jgi:hypothetical protein